MEYYRKGPKLRKSRSGSIPKNIDTVLRSRGSDTSPIFGEKISALQFYAFGDEIRKVAEERVSPDEALEAINTLKRKKRPLVSPGKVGLVGAAITPTVGVLSSGLRGFLDTPGGLRQRLRGAGKEIAAKSTKGAIAGQALAGGLTGYAMQKARGQLLEQAAKKRLNQYIEQVS